jgi:hypothetical protein
MSVGTTLVIQGRVLREEDLHRVRCLIAENPALSRYKLSLIVAAMWDWCDSRGRLKDMAARTLLLKLYRRGLIQLPEARGQQPRRSSRCSSAEPEEAISCTLHDLRPLHVAPVNRDDHHERRRFEAYLERYHYLGFKGHVGENIGYLVRDAKGRVLSCLLFGAAAWKCTSRDEFIGWTPEARANNLSLLAGNTRFLILPWVRVRHLASHILGLVIGRLLRDWKAKYGHPVLLVETFVDSSRFTGTSYIAANWAHVGRTRGRGRQDRFHRAGEPVKEIFVYPLRPSFRELLCRCSC